MASPGSLDPTSLAEDNIQLFKSGISFARNKGLNQADAEDASNAAFFYAVTKYNEDLGTFKDFFFIALRGQIIDRHRSNQRRERSFARDGGETLDYIEHNSHVDSTDGSKAKNEWNLIFKKALEMKGSEYQEMMDFLILRANGLSGSQIAELKEIPLGTVKSNLRRCRAFLKEVALSLNLNPAIND
jgi:RNA polymerase sigma factor (sigma-70 family)